MNEKRSEDLADLIYETPNPKMCRKHPRLVFFDTHYCPACTIEKEVPRRQLRGSEKQFLAQVGRKDVNLS